MAAGRASGRDREYQETCRDVLISMIGARLHPHPLGSDGMHQVLPGSKAKFDIALADDDGNLYVAEAKRWAADHPVRRAHFAAFAWDVEQVRRATGRHVAGHFIAKTESVQAGAVREAQVAPPHGISLLVFEELQALPSYSGSRLLFDEERQRKIRQLLEGFGETAIPGDAYAARTEHADGTEE